MKKSIYFKTTIKDNLLYIKLQNNWNKENLHKIIEELKSFNLKKFNKVFLDFENLKTCDSSSIIYILYLKNTYKTINIINLNKHLELYNLYEKFYQKEDEQKESLKFQNLEDLGKKTYEIYQSSIDFLNFMGKLIYFLIYTILNPSKIRIKSTLMHIEQSAIKALFIVGLTSFLVGVVIAYQGAVQLEKFGANIFIVEMISISMFREIAPLITAIVIAGRSASSYTAEIGAMKITEEIDAMKTMGFEPTIFLTLPRVFALLISLPLLVFFADMVGLIAGMIVSHIDLDITYIEFLHRLQTEVPLKHIIIGIIKSVFFGIAIAIIGCYRGFQVKDNTTSIGKYTTISVVNAIFVVIALNAIFSVILTESGI